MKKNKNDSKNKDSVAKNTKDDKSQEIIDELENKIYELENSWKRALADYQNLQKRHNEEKDAIIKYANLTIILRFLSILDNLEMMQAHMKDSGLEMIIKEFNQILREEGVIELEVLETEYDPQSMDALEVIEGPENKVLEVVNKGYKFKDKILRPARVKVGGKE